MLKKEDEEILLDYNFKKNNVYKITFSRYYDINELNSFFHNKYKKLITIDIVDVSTYYEKIGDLSLKELIDKYDFNEFDLVPLLENCNIKITKDVKSFSYLGIKCIDFLFKIVDGNEFIVNTNDAMALESLKKFYIFLDYLKKKIFFKEICVICFDFDNLETTAKIKIEAL